MALPPLIEKPQRDWLFKVTKQNSKQPERDVCLLGYFFGSACTTLQINRIQVKDVLHKSGKLNNDFVIKGTERKFYLSSKLLRELTLNYIKHRAKNKICLGDNPDQFLGLEPDEALFISYQNKPFSITKKLTKKKNITYACDALNRHVKTLLANAGIQSPSILSGRRTFAVTLHRLGYDVVHIHHLLGNKPPETTQKLLTTDPVSMGDIAAKAF
ncbi:site-specific integrase [Thalassomonas viridans]|uniref:Site-specific integrase n=1 Tax=Thalassomonas viridans TaxID=137584 RepID=A0AAF0CAM1_9GAMM|nr:hypothetical protein [Thalassomonas viridans]WDE06661.1 site-specific integrase [Thalassomonas viridans]